MYICQQCIRPVVQTTSRKAMVDPWSLYWLTMNSVDVSQLRHPEGRAEPPDTAMTVREAA